MGRHARSEAGTASNIARARFAALGLVVLSRAADAQIAGSLTADRARLEQITGDTSLAVRRDSTLPAVPRLHIPAWPMVSIGPEVRITWNSNLPYSLNDGPMWAGRGTSVSVTGGVAYEQRAGKGPARIRVALAPTLWYSENRPFQIIPNQAPDRSAYANPFHGLDSPSSLDLPLRFGDRYLLGVDPGRSSVSVQWPRVTVGVTAENEWWGPGIRNALVMSSNAAGIPRYFARTSEPVRTRLGRFTAELMSGALTKSLFFNQSVGENRTLSGVRVELTPAIDTTLSVGIARVVYAPVGAEASPFTATLSRTFDALLRWENLEGRGLQRSDQISAVYARWQVPRSGFEVYGEWARMALPERAGELLEVPDYRGAWTLGFQYVVPAQRAGRLRLQSELTMLEQSRKYVDRPTVDFYSGQGSPQGYTQRGQIIGAAIGPGASSQWLALDWIAHRWQAGGFVGRIRWENDAMYRLQFPNFWRHDVSILGGVRAGWASRVTDLAIEASIARRYNYLFQNGFLFPGGYRTVDVSNLSVTFIATPR